MAGNKHDEININTSGMTNYRIGPHRPWTEHVNLDIARLVDRLGRKVVAYLWE